MRRRNNDGAVILAVVLIAAATSGHAPKGSGTHLTSVAGATTVSASTRLGQQMAAGYGWTGSQWSCLDWLWTRESGWSAYAVNPSSGAYGIPQALPAAWGHPYALGDPSAQIKWGLKYLADRYGSPCNAWNHEEADGWY